jgi:hypothetical protein
MYLFDVLGVEGSLVESRQIEPVIDDLAKEYTSRMPELCEVVFNLILYEHLEVNDLVLVRLLLMG